MPECRCRACQIRSPKTINGLPVAFAYMILCDTCGNKRCPHATDHRLPCTGSNEPGQLGSIYN